MSFQIVLISNGFTTYAMIIYAQGAMLWNADLNRPIVIGYLTKNLNINVDRPDAVIGNTSQ